MVTDESDRRRCRAHRTPQKFPGRRRCRLGSDGRRGVPSCHAPVACFQSRPSPGPQLRRPLGRAPRFVFPVHRERLPTALVRLSKQALLRPPGLLVLRMSDAVVMSAIPQQKFREICHFAPLGQAEEQVVVLAHVNRAAIAASVFDGGERHHGRRLNDRPAAARLEELLLDLGVGELLAARHDRRSIRIHLHDPGTQERTARMGLKICDLALEPLGNAEVVGVHAGQVSPACLRDAFIGRADDPGVRPPCQADARMACRIELKDGTRSVGRAVVDDDEFEVGEGLCQNAFDGGRHIGPRVVDRHDDGDERGSARRQPGLGGRPIADPRAACGRPSQGTDTRYRASAMSVLA